VERKGYFLINLIDGEDFDSLKFLHRQPYGFYEVVLLSILVIKNCAA
jgi:hypothetical protein